MVIKRICKICLIGFCLAFAFQSLADWPLEEKKIHSLLNDIIELDAVFIRNGSEHTPELAAIHLKMKLDRAQKSWFAPAKEKWTAELFIEKIASKSSISGNPYLIKFKNGKTVTTREWLLERLGEWTP